MIKHWENFNCVKASNIVVETQTGFEGTSAVVLASCHLSNLSKDVAKNRRLE
jgi:hypothetical protein